MATIPRASLPSVALVALLVLCFAGVSQARTTICEGKTNCTVTLLGDRGDNDYLYTYTTANDCGVDVSAKFPYGSSAYLSVSDFDGTPVSGGSHQLQGERCSNRASCDDGPSCCYASVSINEGIADEGTSKSVYITVELSTANAYVLEIERETSCLDLGAVVAVVIAVVLFGCLPCCAVAAVCTGLCYCFGFACFAASNAAKKRRAAGAATYSNSGQPVYGNAGAGQPQTGIQLDTVQSYHGPASAQPYPTAQSYPTADPYPTAQAYPTAQYAQSEQPPAYPGQQPFTQTPPQYSAQVPVGQPMVAYPPAGNNGKSAFPPQNATL